MAFRIMTGYDAPGKDVAAGYQARLEERQEQWEMWMEDYGNCIRAILMAVDDRLKLEESLSANEKLTDAGGDRERNSR